MNIFHNFKATQFYIETLDAVGVDRQSAWTKAVKDRFFKKVNSDEELSSYKITIEDLVELRAEFLSPGNNG